MLFTDKTLFLGLYIQLPQGKLTSTGDIETDTHRETEKDVQKKRKKQVILSTSLHEFDETSLLSFQLANDITNIVLGNEQVTHYVLSLTVENSESKK